MSIVIFVPRYGGPASLVGFLGGFLGLIAIILGICAIFSKNNKIFAVFGIVTGGLTLFPYLLPAISRSKLVELEIADINNLRKLTAACCAYASAHDGQFPSSLAEALPYIGDPDNPQTMRVFLDPSSNSKPLIVSPQNAKNAAWINKNLSGHCDYIYVGAGLNGSNNPGSTIIIYEPLSIHGNGGVVGYIDGHVEWITSNQYSQIAKQFATQK